MFGKGLKPDLTYLCCQLKINHTTLSFNWVLCGLSLSETSPGFYVSAIQVLKTLREKEKLLVMKIALNLERSNFFFEES